MFNKMRLKSALVEYKKRFIQTQWPDEKYKWEAVKCFQVNWDVNADDFAAMLTKALSQTGNLLASVNNFPAKMIIKFAEIAQEEVRAMFIELFDEGKDVYERVDSFKQKSNRSEFNADKTKLLRPSLYTYFSNDESISFCYYSDETMENDDETILKIFSSR